MHGKHRFARVVGHLGIRARGHARGASRARQARWARRTGRGPGRRRPSPAAHGGQRSAEGGGLRRGPARKGSASRGRVPDGTRLWGYATAGFNDCTVSVYRYWRMCGCMAMIRMTVSYIHAHACARMHTCTHANNTCVMRSCIHEDMQTCRQTRACMQRSHNMQNGVLSCCF